MSFFKKSKKKLHKSIVEWNKGYIFDPTNKQTVMSDFQFSTLQEITQHAINTLNDGVGCGEFGSDLHGELFNRDYYIIGRRDAEQWLIKHMGVFNAIDIIQQYESSNFGQVYTELHEPEHIVNMIVYIAGQDVLNRSNCLQKRWDSRLLDQDINQIVSELQELFFS